MDKNLKKDGGYEYLEIGKGQPLIILHGLMGNLSNFDGMFTYFPQKGYRIIMPQLPIYNLPLLKTNVKHLAKFVKGFITYKNLENYILIGNSLGGHIALYYSKLNPEKISGMILTGSSGLYENAMGGGYPRRGDYEYVTKKVQDVFYDPKTATKEIIDESFDVINNRSKLIRILTIAKSAIRHNMAKDLPKMKMPVCLIWGKNDKVTPPNVAEEFKKLLPNSELNWVDKCGHAPMMERPDVFNEIIEKWLTKNKF
ncbi:MAG: alpha/beta hydrolase [Flavobacteriaceae bacterium]|nr:alpha/beta hydrolase [Flavobacteriaceae bacterium]